MTMTATNNMELWDKVKQPPKEALKTISGGRLSGMTDISPQWRYQVLTEALGACGEGWWYEIDKTWTEDGPDGAKAVFVQVSLHIGDGHPVPGIGGSMLIAKEKSGLHFSDEAYKMAVTDALSVAMKMVGVAADIYMGKWDGSKYKDAPPVDKQKKTTKKAETESTPATSPLTEQAQFKAALWAMAQAKKVKMDGTNGPLVIAWMMTDENTVMNGMTATDNALHFPKSDMPPEDSGWVVLQAALPSMDLAWVVDKINGT